MNVLDDPRVTARPAVRSVTTEPNGNDYLIEGGPTGYVVAEVQDGWSNSGQPPGWVVFNGYTVWIGTTSHPALLDINEVDAKDVYPTAEAAVAAVLVELDKRVT